MTTTARTFNTADSVRHKPTGETWGVLIELNGYVYNMGWPQGCNPVDQFELVERATPYQRINLARRLIDSVHGVSKGHGIEALRQLAQDMNLPKNAHFCQDVRGGIKAALRSKSRRVPFCTDAEGHPMTPSAAAEMLMEELAKGRDVIPAGSQCAAACPRAHLGCTGFVYKHGPHQGCAGYFPDLEHIKRETVLPTAAEVQS